ncbi:MAG: mannose-6-phosphate isomerase, class I [Ilumatobacteraceae bacterium]
MAHLLSGTVQHYDWGDQHTIPTLLGVKPDARPWAELWFGTHRGGPSVVNIDGDTQALAAYAGELSFLVKVIASAWPLSLQTHPTHEQAIIGFENENAIGIALDDPRRIYQDASAKPELLCALSNFEAVCGFRPVDESLQMCNEFGWDELADHLRSDGLEQCVRWALSTENHVLPTHLPEWAQRLATTYPGSGGILVALLMHHVQLLPGEALFLDAGNVHAYLNGTAVEVMSSSDNVVRAAFTKKHINIDEFLLVGNFSPAPPPLCLAVNIGDGCWEYPVSTSAFGAQRIEVHGNYLVTATHHAEILLCLDGDAGILTRGQTTVLRSGEALQLSGPATVFRTWGSQ